MRRKRTKREVIGYFLITLAVLVLCGILAVHYIVNSTSNSPSPVGKQYRGKPISKSETVYIDTDSKGRAQSATVDALLRNNTGSKSIRDTSSLKDIVNVNGNETFTDNGDGTITWDAQGRNMFYEGAGDPKDIPVEMEVTYLLNGKPISADKLIGKSGDLEIQVEYKNLTSVDLNGSEEKVPFTVISAMIVNDKSLSKLKVNTGTVVEQGNIKIALGLAVPGMAEELDKDGIDSSFGNKVIFRGKAKNLKSNEIITVISNDSVKSLSKSLLKTLDMDSKINKLDKSTKKLVDGTNQLHEGTTLLKTRLPEYTGGLAQATEANGKVTDATELALLRMKEATEKLSTFASALQLAAIYVGTVVNDEEKGITSVLGQQTEDINAINEELSKMDEQINALKEAASAVTDENVRASLNEQIAALETSKQNILERANSLKEGNDQLLYDARMIDIIVNEGQPEGVDVTEYEEMLKLFMEMFDLDTDILEYMKREDGTYMSLVELMQLWVQKEDDLTEEIRRAIEDKGSLMYYMKELNTGINKLNDSSDTLIKGVDKLDKGSAKLDKGMKLYYDTGIKKLVQMYDKYLKGMSKKLKKLKAAGKEYDNFSGLSEGMTGSVKFVYFTPIGE